MKNIDVFYLFFAQANSRNALLNEKASAAPYFLRSRVPLGNASNVIGPSKAADKLPKVMCFFSVNCLGKITLVLKVDN